MVDVYHLVHILDFPNIALITFLVVHSLVELLVIDLLLWIVESWILMKIQKSVSICSADQFSDFQMHVTTVTKWPMPHNPGRSVFDECLLKVDTFVKMLQEVNRVTAPMAYGIANRYPSALDLLDAMKRQGPTMLENVRKSANKNGALTDSRIGPAVSKRLYKVFMQSPA